MKKITLIFLLTTLAVGCSSRPPEVIASRPLVETNWTNGSDELTNPSLESFLDSALAGATFSGEGQQFLVLRRYYSALGSDCIQYAEIGVTSKRSIVCKDESKWMLYPWMNSGISVFDSQGIN
ncbi:hypothetical protein [uncultured Umboniibacter sp.]|uniref:hypothetical protein n=1 Tax=uncultured Umboniibacter sp. TaxID=1798917 RepID=UPI00263330BC|nr:hypothetical protein [uncultured Umboniibacter sp.]